MTERLNRARETGRRAEQLAEEAKAARAEFACQCAELHEAGLSIAQIADGLGISPQAAHRLILRGRSTSL